MLGFYYKHGQPNFFPAKFTGEDGYCKPYPHYNLLFANNHTWFLALITLWRSMIPEDGSEFAAVSRKFTNRQILVLLHDRPFSSLAQVWKRENPSVHVEANPIEKSAKKHAAAHMDSLIVPGWNATWSKQVMSPELTDDEGGKQVKWPQWRADWNIDICDRIDGAEWTKDKPWRKSPKGAAWMKASTHLIDYKLKHKLDISAFLKAHPPLRPSMVEEKEGEMEGGDVVELELELEAEVEDKDAGTSKGKEIEDDYTADGDKIEIDPQLPSLLQAQPKARHPRPCVAPIGAPRPTIPVYSVAHTTLSMSPVPLPATHIPLQPQYLMPGLDKDAASQDPYQQNPGFTSVDPDAHLQSQHVSGSLVAVTHQPYNDSIYSATLVQQPLQPSWPMPPPPTLSQQNAAIPVPQPIENLKRKKRTVMTVVTTTRDQVNSPRMLPAQSGYPIGALSQRL
ncbi:hypothetical protein RSOL_129660, partial [Rhizoctonia solani AG-3 Rhs1AP]